MSTTIYRRVRAAFPVRKARALRLLAFAKLVYASMLAQALRFPSPIVPLAILLTEIDAFHLAEQALHGGARGPAASARDTARNAVWLSLINLKAYVQMVADANPENAIEIIKSAGFAVVASYTRHKAILDAQLGNAPGEVNLFANAALLTGGSKERPTYHWEYSIDGGQTWVAVLGTPRATTTITGLPSMTWCSFRVCVTLGKTTHPWSQAVTIAVH